MRRREFIKAAVSSASLWPFVARAQQPVKPIIGYLGAETPERFGSRLIAFRQGLGEMGFEEGRNVTIEYRWANGHNDRLPALAAELVRRNVNVIATPGSGVAALAAKSATTTIPIVFETGLDPVTTGLVKSLSRPEGNVTGVTSLNVDVTPKGLELMRELLPQSKNFSILVNPANKVNFDVIMKGLEVSSRTLGVELHFLNASNDSEIEAALAKQSQLGGGLVISADIFFNSRPQSLAALTLKHAVPAVHTVREFAASGGLMSYGGDIRDTHRQAGVYTGRILKGEMPANLPVQLATKVELFINLKTAKALGITVPLPLSGRADELFE